MKKKFKISLFIFLFLILFAFIGLWNLVSDGYDKQNQVILNLKKIIPRGLAVKVRDTFFIIPELKTRNKLLELQVNKYEQGLDGQLFAKNKVYSKNKKEALTLLEFLTSEKAQKLYDVTLRT